MGAASKDRREEKFIDKINKVSWISIFKFSIFWIRKFIQIITTYLIISQGVSIVSHKKYTWIGNWVFGPVLALICLLNPVSTQPKVVFHGGFHLAPQFLTAGDPYTNTLGIVGFDTTMVIDNESVLMMPYRIRLRAEIAFREGKTLKANIGFVAANGPVNILPFSPDNLNQFRPTWDIINTVSSDRNTAGGTNMPNVVLEKANIYWKPIPGATSYEVVLGLYDIFDHFPLDQYFTGSVGVATNNAVVYEDKAFVGTIGYNGDSFTPTLITVTPSVWGVAGRMTSKMFSLEMGWHTSDINNITKTGGPIEGVGFNSAPSVGENEYTDYNAASFQAGFYAAPMGLKGGYRFGYGKVWNSAISQEPASAWFINIDQEITPNTGMGGIMAYFIYDEAEENPVNYSLSGNKAKIGAGITYSPNGFGFIAKDYMGFGWARITSHEAEGGFLPARFAPRIGTHLPQEQRMEFFWRHRVAPGMDIIPGWAIIQNPAGDEEAKNIMIFMTRLVYLF